MKHESTKHEAQKAVLRDAPFGEIAEAANATKPEAETPEANGFAPLPPTATLAEVIARVNELADRASFRRDRGPESKGTMTEEDARRIMLGDLKEASHTKAAQVLGRSYGQVYSARKGFTYKSVYKASDKRW